MITQRPLVRGRKYKKLRVGTSAPASQLAKYLNESRQSRIPLVKRMQKLVANLAHISAQVKKRGWYHTVFSKGPGAIDKAVRDIDQELKRHRVRPRLIAPSPHGFEFSWNGCYPIILKVISLGEAGELWRVRQCRTCSLWFSADRQTNWSCSEKCRKRHYNATEDAKKLNRKRVKAYYDRNYKSTRKGKK